MFVFLKGRLTAVRLILLAAVLTLIAIGIATIYSVGNPADVTEAGEMSGVWKKQLVFAGVGLAGFVLINLISYRRLGLISYGLYAAVLLVVRVPLPADVRATRRPAPRPDPGSSFSAPGV